MPTLEYFIVGRGGSVDQFTNTVSIFSILDEVTPRRFPMMMLRIMAFVGWNAADEERGHAVNVNITVRGPGLENPFVSDLDFTVERKRHRHVANFVGLPVRGVGEIEFELRMNGEPVAHHHILVNEPDANALPDGWMMYAHEEQPTVDEPQPAQRD